MNSVVGVHQGPVLRLWKLLYASNLVLIAETLPNLEKKFWVWKQSLESNSLRINLTKTKVLVSRETNKLQDLSGK